MAETSPHPPEGEHEMLVRRVRALAADPAAAGFGLGMATHSWPELALGAVEAGDPDMLGMLRHDAVRAAALMPPAERDALDARLRGVGAAPVGPAAAAHLAELRAIRARGRLASEEEYHLGRDRVDYVRGHPDHRDEAAEWEALFRAWHAEHPRGHAGMPGLDAPAT